MTVDINKFMLSCVINKRQVGAALAVSGQVFGLALERRKCVLSTQVGAVSAA